MPFVAFDPERQERINILHYRQPKEDLAGRQLVCPLCGVALVVRHGVVHRPHFAHRQHCPYASWTQAQTPEHLATKETIAAWLRQDPLWHGAAIDLEAKLPEIRRVADILVTFPDGTQVAHECQLSRLPLKKFQARSQAYAQAGIHVYWWFRAGYLKRTRHDLVAALVDHQGTRLGVSFRKQRNPHHGDVQHRVYHTWPYQVHLWAYHPDLLSMERQRLQGPQQLPRAMRLLVWQSLLWEPVSQVLAEATDWQPAAMIHARLPSLWQSRLSPAGLDYLLPMWWARGQVVAGPGGWRLSNGPNVNALTGPFWSRRRVVAAEQVEPQPAPNAADYARWVWYLHSARTLYELRAVGEAIRLREGNPLVLERLRPLYRECQTRLQQLERSD